MKRWIVKIDKKIQSVGVDYVNEILVKETRLTSFRMYIIKIIQIDHWFFIKEVGFWEQVKRKIFLGSFS